MKNDYNFILCKFSQGIQPYVVLTDARPLVVLRRVSDLHTSALVPDGNSKGDVQG